MRDEVDDGAELEHAQQQLDDADHQRQQQRQPDELVGEGHDVFVFLRASSDRSRLRGLPVQLLEGDALVEADVQRAMRAARFDDVVNALGRSESGVDFFATTGRNIVQAAPSRLTLVFESFAFKHGVPMDADFVFDVRMLPNPHYEPELKPMTGRDAPVAAFLAASADVQAMAVAMRDSVTVSMAAETSGMFSSMPRVRRVRRSTSRGSTSE